MQFGRSAQGGIWPPGHRLPEEWFKRAIVDFTYWFYYKGQGELIDLDTGKVYPLRAGVCLLMRPGMRLMASQTGEEGLGNLYFHVNLLQPDETVLPLEKWPSAPLHTEVFDFDFFNIATRHLLMLLQRSKDKDCPNRTEARLAAEHLFKGLVLDLCYLHRLPQFSSTTQHHQRAIEKALWALHEQPQQYPSVEAWAATSGYSASHFRALCLKFTGKSPMEHLIHARIKHAKEYLRGTSLTVGMIAHQLGYENPHYFSRQFRQQTGMTASEYRQRAVQGR